MNEHDAQTYEDLARTRQHAVAICDRLGLDPNETTDLQLHVEPGRHAYITWESRRRIPLADVPALFAGPETEDGKR
jgi:hypothetical protein